MKTIIVAFIFLIASLLLYLYGYYGDLSMMGISWSIFGATICLAYSAFFFIIYFTNQIVSKPCEKR